MVLEGPVIFYIFFALVGIAMAEGLDILIFHPLAFRLGIPVYRKKLDAPWTGALPALQRIIKKKEGRFCRVGFILFGFAIYLLEKHRSEKMLAELHEVLAVSRESDFRKFN